MSDKEEMIAIHGEKYRRLINDAIEWLDANEPKWNLSEPIDRKEFIAELVSKAVVKS